MTTKNKFRIARNILETSMNASDTSTQDFDLWEIKDKLQEIIDNVVDCENVDHNLDLPCGEVRIISEDHIDELWSESLEEQIKECYDLSEVPSFIVIDWETTVNDCKNDGLGHHFSSYDGQEHNIEGNLQDYYIFRTN